MRFFTFFPPVLLLAAMKFAFFLVVVLSLQCGTLKAQNTRFSRHEIGLSIAIPFIYEKMPEGYYQPILLKGQFGWNLGRTENIANKTGHLIGYLEPQFNPVFVSGKLKDIEFGCNFGFRYEKELGDLDRLYWAIGTGPHFITVRTSMQARGYIFSDNFIMGWYHQMGDGPYQTNLQYRFRHISNAGFMKPNKGIDNSFVVLGVSRFITE